MRGTVLADFLARKSATRRAFQGVYPVDRLPVYIQYPCALVVNTDESTKDGEHWTAIYVSPSGFGIYFDSVGLPPLHPLVIRFLNTHCRTWTYSRRNIQGILSDKCGIYCLYFLHEIARGVTLYRLSQPFSTFHPYLNDIWVLGWFNRHW